MEFTDELEARLEILEELEDIMDIILREDEPVADWNKVKEDLLKKD
jgi:hypothetical protein